ncbi:aristolochene synthase [Moniliophthora roreri MCA 2997]|uniref:Terpene synthase n=2 Tax=Moniliophthora roreri TaxID=221103 RepID=V2X872_MONRO|nr:aristolochene synthase [Moniliophthora roreri MCA 2997]KAI3611346.1 aristolochene synthase [Moniliophthora roreri]
MSLQVPPLDDNFPPIRFHDHADEIAEVCNKYILEHWPFRDEKDRQNFLSIRVSYLASTVTPFAKSIPKTTLFCIFVSFFTLLDDFIDRGEVDVTNKGPALLALLPPPYDHKGPIPGKKGVDLSYMMQDMWAQLRSLSSREEYETVCNGIQLFFKAQKNPTITSVDEYLEARRIQIGCTLIFPLMRVAMEVHPTIEEMSNPLVTQPEVLAGKAAVLLNDICSWEREKAAKESNNCIARVMEWTERDEETSFKAVVDLNRQLEVDLWHACTRVVNSDLSYDAKAYGHSLAYMVGANAWFFKNSTRYSDHIPESEKM